MTKYIKWICIITLIPVILWGLILIGSRYSLRLKYIAETPYNSFFCYTTEIPSISIEEAKRRGSLVFEYETPPIVDYKDSLITLDIKEAFLEHTQRYNLFKNLFINNENEYGSSYYLVLVFSERGKGIVKAWNNEHHYVKIYLSNRKFNSISKIYFCTQYKETPLKGICADSLVLDIKELFYLKKPYTYELKEVWRDHYHFGTITLIKKEEYKNDSSGTKWIVPYHRFNRDIKVTDTPNKFIFMTEHENKE